MTYANSPPPPVPSASNGAAWKTLDPQTEVEPLLEHVDRSPAHRPEPGTFSLGFVVVGAVPAMFVIAWLRGAFPNAPYMERWALEAMFVVAIALILFAQYKRKPRLKRIAIQVFFAASGGSLYWDLAMWLHSLSKP